MSIINILSDCFRLSFIYFIFPVVFYSFIFPDLFLLFLPPVFFPSIAGYSSSSSRRPSRAPPTPVSGSAHRSPVSVTSANTPPSPNLHLLLPLRLPLLPSYLRPPPTTAGLRMRRRCGSRAWRWRRARAPAPPPATTAPSPFLPPPPPWWPCRNCWRGMKTATTSLWFNHTTVTAFVFFNNRNFFLCFSFFLICLFVFLWTPVYLGVFAWSPAGHPALIDSACSFHKPSHITSIFTLLSPSS